MTTSNRKMRGVNKHSSGSQTITVSNYGAAMAMTMRTSTVPLASLRRIPRELFGSSQYLNLQMAKI